MATVKSYTDIEQSKKLAEILPLESADMYWFRDDTEIPKVFPQDMMHDSASVTLPCWSLAALLNVIPKHIKDYNVLRIDNSNNDFAIWYVEIGFGVNKDLPDITTESAVDACYEMIIRLNELNLL